MSQEETAPADTAERRRADRYAVDMPAVLSIGDQTAACRMVEMSAFGARLDGIEGLSEGDRLVLDLPNAGRVEATVVRRTDSYVAVAFAGAVIVASRHD